MFRSMILCLGACLATTCFGGGDRQSATVEENEPVFVKDVFKRFVAVVKPKACAQVLKYGLLGGLEYQAYMPDLEETYKTLSVTERKEEVLRQFCGGDKKRAWECGSLLATLMEKVRAKQTDLFTAEDLHLDIFGDVAARIWEKRQDACKEIEEEYPGVRCMDHIRFVECFDFMSDNHE